MRSVQILRQRCLFIALAVLVAGCDRATDRAAVSTPPSQTTADDLIQSEPAATPQDDDAGASPQDHGASKSPLHEDASISPRNDDAGSPPQEDPDAHTPTLPDDGEEPEEPEVQAPPKRLEPPVGARQLDPAYDVWIDPERKAVIVDGFVAFREGPLEMFACTRGTKEHESIVSANTRAFLVHAALLNVGAEVGGPVQFVPEFRPPTGTEIEIQLEWEDETGQRHTARAQDWVRDARSGEALEHPWVFAGSSFWKDEETGVSHYQAEAGDFICVSNFASAMLDIPVESTQANEGLAFEAFTERIPSLGTHVRLTLVPKLPESERDESEREEALEDAAN